MLFGGSAVISEPIPFDGGRINELVELPGSNGKKYSVSYEIGAVTITRAQLVFDGKKLLPDKGINPSPVVMEAITAQLGL